jgi:hypothetical protein
MQAIHLPSFYTAHLPNSPLSTYEKNPAGKIKNLMFLENLTKKR